MLKAIPQRWRELSGRENWRGLLKPLDNDLRRYLIQYGERAQATYDTFAGQEASRYAGSSMFPPENLFNGVGLTKNNPFKYKVVKYLYATSKVKVPGDYMMRSESQNPFLKESNFIGYVAVATDEGKQALGRRDILVAWRGTTKPIEWLEDYDYPLTPAAEIFGRGTNANVHEGFLSVYTSSDPSSTHAKESARAQVLREVKSLVEQYKNEETSITITGHSLGGALATLNAADIVANGYNKTNQKSNISCTDDKPLMVTAFPWATPRVGDSNFKQAVESLKDLHTLKIRNIPDLVPNTPPPPFVHVGEELQVNSTQSPYLDGKAGPGEWHLLEPGYLHPLSLTQGSEGGLDRVECTRDIALANKEMAALKPKYLIPGAWWGLRNKGMVQQEDGSWMLNDHDIKE